MKSYVDYVFYKDTFKGNKITSKEEFEQLSIRATQYVKQHIFDRDFANYKGKDYTEQVKYATCSIAEIEQDYQKGLKEISGGQVKSESIGDFSRTFSNNDELTKNAKIRKKEELKLYLSTTGLLFRGLDNV